MQRGLLNNVEESDKRNGEAVLGTTELHVMDQLKVQRENLLGIARWAWLIWLVESRGGKRVFSMSLVTGPEYQL